MLGADIGTALVVVVISFNVAVAVPILLLAGVVTFLVGTSRKARNLGRLAIGLGLLVLALRLILGNMAPLGNSALFVSVVEALSHDIPLAILFAALVTWMAHSSLAIVLLVASFASAGLVSMEGAFALVLGANVGAPIAAVVAVWRGHPGGRQVALGNLGLKTIGCLCAAITLGWSTPWVLRISPDPTVSILAFHCGFNVFLASVFLPFVGTVSSFLARVVPDLGSETGSTELQTRLARDALDNPGRALGNAARETLLLGDEVARMFDEAMQAMKNDDEDAIDRSKQRDDTIDGLYEDIKTYLIEIRQVPLTEAESHRSADIMAFTLNLEHMGDILVRNVLATASRKAKKKLRFSKEGAAEIERIGARVRANLQLALNVFVSRDRELARTLLQEKEALRDIELEAVGSHLERLEAGKPESIETSSLHLDVLRDLKRINSHLTSVAYPILIEAGELRTTRLMKDGGIDKDSADWILGEESIRG